ncbi:DUF4395 family protein [Pengzhenrongella frigida]|uniref:DUF4395 family protein n=1 Tax=Pengzhenrongella frigida TaxID=1259133 RepID=A0A4Q5MZ07_9MICO|nr:DUF4395 family protein [Cellulomonas sp. HLT2-17]RYV49477.1 DUF4395 family protein [Cellulomonas sp. HLT2-17]
MAKLSASLENNLNKQGFEDLDAEAKSCFAMPLRFTPAVGTILIVIGLLSQSAIWIGIMALVALSGSIWPKGMALDLVYNLVVRRILRSPPLPPTPTPRRFSYLLSTAMLAISALFFYIRAPLLGSIFGGTVAIGGAILTGSLWCLGSWIYRLFLGSKRRVRKSG